MSGAESNSVYVLHTMKRLQSDTLIIDNASACTEGSHVSQQGVDQTSAAVPP